MLSARKYVTGNSILLARVVGTLPSVGGLVKPVASPGRAWEVSNISCLDERYAVELKWSTLEAFTLIDNQTPAVSGFKVSVPRDRFCSEMACR